MDTTTNTHRGSHLYRLHSAHLLIGTKDHYADTRHQEFASLQENKATRGLSKKVACAQRINMTKASSITGKNGACFASGSHIDGIAAEFLDSVGVACPETEEERQRGDASDVLD